MPNPREVNAWNNSTQFLKNAIRHANLTDNMLVLEYGLPYSSQRIDCLLFGKGLGGSDNAVVMELKQWSMVKPCDVENNVITYIAGAERMEAHPSYQVAGYHYYLEDFLTVFQDTPGLKLSSCC
ncbi:MAG: peptidase S24, partial [Thermoprotei archaeon]